MEIFDVEVINAYSALRYILDFDLFNKYEQMATERVMGDFLLPKPIAKWLETDEISIKEPIPSEAFKNLITSDHLGFRVFIDRYHYGMITFKGIYFWPKVYRLRKNFVIEINLNKLVTEGLLGVIKAQYLEIMNALSKSEAVYGSPRSAHVYVTLDKVQADKILRKDRQLTQTEWAHILLPITIYNFVRVILNGALIGKTTHSILGRHSVYDPWVTENPVLKNGIIDFKSKLLECGENEMEIIENLLILYYLLW